MSASSTLFTYDKFIKNSKTNTKDYLLVSERFIFQAMDGEKESFFCTLYDKVKQESFMSAPQQPIVTKLSYNYFDPKYRPSIKYAINSIGQDQNFANYESVNRYEIIHEFQNETTVFYTASTPMITHPSLIDYPEIEGFLVGSEGANSTLQLVDTSTPNDLNFIYQFMSQEAMDAAVDTNLLSQLSGFKDFKDHMETLQKIFNKKKDQP